MAGRRTHRVAGRRASGSCVAMASQPGHGRGKSFEPNSYRDVPRSGDDGRVTDCGGQPGGVHYYADRDDAPIARGPHYGKGPEGFERSDARLWELVCEALHDDDQVDATHVTVEVARGEVTLGGLVDDDRTKSLAEACVARVAGVKAVQNQIDVRQLHG